MQLIATDQHRVIIGLGLTGLSCARFLASRQLPFSVVDSRLQPPALDQFKAEFPNAALTLGAITDQSLRGATELIVSPGVSLREPAIAAAIAAGTRVIGDIDLFRREVSAPIIAITGSNGKSTVTTLVGELIRACDRTVLVGGNIGLPALDLLEQPQPDYYVLELSSFQLERGEPLAAEVATVLNVSADHMDRYPDMMAYYQAKHRIFRSVQQVVVNRTDPLSAPLVAEGVKQWSFGLDKPDIRGFGLIREQEQDYLAFEFTPLMAVSELKIAGRHNIENALAALALGYAVGMPIAPMLNVLRNFSGLPHRCQYVAECRGVRFFDDSKGTNVGASIAAMTGLAPTVDKLVLIAGGQSKGADLSPLLPVLKKLARAMVVIGEAAEQLVALVENVLPVQKAASMEEAVNLAMSLAQPGDAVLLSPACASFDMFSNYQHRGEVFSQAVLSLASSRVMS